MDPLSAVRGDVEMAGFLTNRTSEIKPDFTSTKRSHYPGQGTQGDPFVVDWDLADVQNPYNWSRLRKWAITFQMASSTFVVSIGSSYTGEIKFMMNDLRTSQEVVLLGISLYVIGFGLGPLVFAPLSEVYGRRPVFLCAYMAHMFFHLGGSLGQNMVTLVISRLFAGLFGSCPLSNAGGVLSDVWIPRERGVAASLYSMAPCLGPLIGPIIGGYVSVVPQLGWRFSFWIMFVCSALVIISNFILVPETYTPVLLRGRACRSHNESEKKIYYVSKYDLKRSTSFAEVLRLNLSRPFVFMCTEPIVVVASLYISLAYALIYAFLAAFPIIFQEHRGFSPGEGGLAFLGVAVGVLVGLCLVPIQNKYYWKTMDNSKHGRAPPEARLYTTMLGGVLLPIGLFWLAWTSQPDVHWIVPIMSGIPFGCATSQIIQGFQQYLMDAYTIYCASAIATTIVLRSIFAAVFPLFSPVMFHALGDQWAVSVFGFLALVGMPLPVLFLQYGRWIRSKSVYAYSEDRDEPQSSGISETPNDNMIVESEERE